MRKIVCCILTILLGLCCLTACNIGGESSLESSQNQSSSSSNGVQITQNEVSLTVGESVQLEAKSDKGNVYIFWSVRDENVATVSDEGLITGVAEGQTICYASFGGQTAMCLVKVSAEKAKPLLSAYTPYTEGITIYVGDTFDPLITAKLGDSVCEDAQVEYVEVDAAIIGVEDGKLVARGVGNTTVSVKVTYETQTVSLSLSVNVVEMGSAE